MKNPFAFFGLTPSLNIDAKLLRKLYLDLQRGSHPDLAAGDTDANAISEQANANYKILCNPLSLVKAYIDCLGENPDVINTLPKVFLMEMMDLSDAIEEMDRGNVAEMSQVESQLNQYLHALNQEFVGFQSQENPNIRALSEWYQKSKYIGRLRKNFDGIVEI